MLHIWCLTNSECVRVLRERKKKYSLKRINVSKLSRVICCLLFCHLTNQQMFSCQSWLIIVKPFSKYYQTTTKISWPSRGINLHQWVSVWHLILTQLDIFFRIIQIVNLSSGFRYNNLFVKYYLVNLELTFWYNDMVLCTVRSTNKCA